MNILENGEVDWVTFAKSLDIPVIPSTGTPKSGEEFLQMIRESILKSLPHAMIQWKK